MKLKREKIKEFDIPEEHFESFLNELERKMGEIESEVPEDDIYLVINRAIESKYRPLFYKNNMKETLELNKGLTETYDSEENLIKYNIEFGTDLIIKIIEGEGSETLLPSWTIPEEEKQEILSRKGFGMSEKEYWRNY